MRFVFSKELGYILGVLKGDGRIKKRYNAPEGLTLKVKDADFVDYFREVVERWMGKKGKIEPIKHNGRTYLEFAIYSRSRARFLENFNLKDLLKADERTIEGFLEGFIDSDGYISKRSNAAYFYNCDLNLLKFIKSRLGKIGVNSHIIRKVVGKNAYSKRPRYAVAITNKYNLIKLREKICLHIARKQERLIKVQYGVRGNKPYKPSKWNFMINKTFTQPLYKGRAGRLRLQ